MRGRAEYLALVEEQSKERAASQRPQLEVAQQQAVSAEKLTGHPEWDRYISYLQARIEEAKSLLRGFEEKLTAPEIVDHSELLKAKMGARECIATIAAWETAISLPKDLIEAGEKAVSILERISKNED